MSPRVGQEASEISPLNAGGEDMTSVGYGSATESGSESTTLKGILRSAPSDLRGSMRSLRALVDAHTGIFLFLEIHEFWFAECPPNY